MSSKSNLLSVGQHALLCAILASSGFSVTAYAQDTAPAVADDATRSAGLEDIVVTAQKKSRGEKLQDVPIAATALGPAQLAETHFQSLPDIATRAPGVLLGQNGLAVGFASFNLRGLGTSSGNPSSETATGVFIDGVYIGSQYGTNLQTFDLEGVEILRGPQGTLQGRNVTGGAVLIRTRRPTDKFEMNAQASIQTGPEYNIAASVGGPILGDVVKAKVAGYYNKDEGWFHDSTVNRDVGKQRTWFVRPTVVIEPSSGFSQTFIGEVGKTRGDSTIFQQVPVGIAPDALGFKINSNTPGYTILNWENVTSETNINVPFGDGVITNIAGYRHVFNESLTDIDGGPTTLFNSHVALKQRQFSEELRYAGTFGNLEATVGLYYFWQKYLYIEARDIFGAHREYGGTINQKAYAIFSQLEYHASDKLSLVLGGRYSSEKKEAVLSYQLAAGSGGNCNIAIYQCVNPDFVGSKRWPSFTPKFGVNYKPDENVLFYVTASKGVRSGGYNVRQRANANGSPSIPQFDPETQWSYEAGLKSDLLDRKLRFNFAGFYSDVKKLQRDIVLTLGPGQGVTQLTKNAADADIYGFESEVIAVLSTHFRINANVAYVKVKYKNVIYDLNNDGVINSRDYALKPTRYAPWNYNIGGTYTTDFGDNARLTGTVNYSYRDANFSDDTNLSPTTTIRDLTANLAVSFPKTGLDVSVYGKNILNDGQEAFILPLTGTLRGRAMAEGRTVGAQVKYHF
jgi:iron complex outermembrane recepter protein